MLVKYLTSIVERTSVFNSCLWNEFSFFDVKQNGKVTAGEVARRIARLARLTGASNEDAREVRKHTQEFL